MSSYRLSDFDLYLWNQGQHWKIYEKLGAHLGSANGQEGVFFAVWAPNAARVSVAGDFNHWKKDDYFLHHRGDAGVWEGFVPGAKVGDRYKYFIEGYGGRRLEKADPFAFYAENPPATASVVWDLTGYTWGDHAWMEKRKERHHLRAPISIYEVHLGSWLKAPLPKGSTVYREAGKRLAQYASRMGYTHVEFLPIMEHPFDGSWGYQVTGYFAPTSRFGTPQDFMALVDELHQAGVGVILDWVPAHFPRDAHGLALFDGTHLFEHADPKQGWHPDWDTCIFNYDRHEVSNFLIANALFWLEYYHVDGLRVDAVASMLYLDYSRKEGEWVPNRYGGRENLGAINFIRRCNEKIYGTFPDVFTVAEESTAWPMVSRPTYLGGLGFGYKWDMGWMHDTLRYFQKDPVHRKFHHQDLTFRMLYAFTENYVLPLSHDEVVHGKGSLWGRMPGDAWQKAAGVRLLLACQFAHCGKKLLFMGGEFGQESEWTHERGLDWFLLKDPLHGGIHRLARDLNTLYRAYPALFEGDADPSGFEWIDCNDALQSTLVFMRKTPDARQAIVAVFNFTPVPRWHFQVGLPFGGDWKEILNTDAELYGGSGIGNYGKITADPEPFHGRPFSARLSLPPLAAVWFCKDRNPEDRHA